MGLRKSLLRAGTARPEAQEKGKAKAVIYFKITWRALSMKDNLYWRRGLRGNRVQIRSERGALNPICQGPLLN